MKRKLKAKDIIMCGLFTALIAVGAFIKIPIPVVPFTLQFLFTMMAGLLLGGNLGAISVVAYILIGLAGVPVFAEGGGFWYVLKPSFGYLIGFAIATFVTGHMADKLKKYTVGRIMLINFLGLFIVYLAGMVYYYVICNYVIDSPIGLWTVILYCFILAVPGDIFLCVISAFLAKRIKPVINKM